MASHVVLLPPADGDPAHAHLVRDGFAWLALPLPVLWLAWHRLWLPAALVLAAQGVLAAAMARGALTGGAVLLDLLLALYVALEGRGWSIARRVRAGWREAGVMHAGDGLEAETRWAVGLLAGRQAPGAPAAAASAAVAAPSSGAPASGAPSLGGAGRSAMQWPSPPPPVNLLFGRP